MRKKLTAFFLGAMTLCLVACGENTDKGNSSQETTTISNAVENTTDKKEEKTEEKTTEEKTTEEETTVDEEASKQAERDAVRARMENIKVSVLATSSMPYENAMIDGYGYYEADNYDTATIVTMLVEFPDEDLYYCYEGLNVVGASVTGDDGKLIPHTYSSTGWVSDNQKYALLVMRVAGEVDTTTFGVNIKGKVYLGDDNIIVERQFENEGKPVGFDYAKECFVDEDSESWGLDSLIVKLKGRHYFTLKRYENTYAGAGWGDVHSYILMPLEGGLTRTLTTADISAKCEVELPNTSFKVTVNESGRVDTRYPKCQTTIDVDVLRVETPEEEAILEEDRKNEEVKGKIKADIKTIFDNVIVEVDDGDGNIVKLSYK